MSEALANQLALRLLSTADVLARLGIGRTTLWEMEKREAFPKAIHLNRRCKRWRAAEIEAFLDQAT